MWFIIYSLIIYFSELYSYNLWGECQSSGLKKVFKPNFIKYLWFAKFQEIIKS